MLDAGDNANLIVLCGPTGSARQRLANFWLRPNSAGQRRCLGIPATCRRFARHQPPGEVRRTPAPVLPAHARCTRGRVGCTALPWH